MFDVRTFGGVGDGTTLNTRAFAAAVAAAHAYYASAGAPGTVLAAGGVYFSGQIELLSGVTLSVAPDARLLGSSNKSDYPSDEAKWAFIYAYGARDIAVVGGGAIDGNYRKWIVGFNETNDQYLIQGALLA